MGAASMARVTRPDIPPDAVVRAMLTPDCVAPSFSVIRVAEARELWLL